MEITYHLERDYLLPNLLPPPMPPMGKYARLRLRYLKEYRPAFYVMSLLRQQKAKQAEMQLRAGPAWQDSGLVFTNEQGRYVSLRAVYDSYKRIVKKIGLPNLRIHDLRHNYAVNSIRAGDDIKSLQSNLGHATAAFTLDIYGHFTEDMQSESSQRMEHFIENVLNL